MNSTFTRDELINVLRGWHKAFKQMGRGHERNVKALAEAADMLERGKWISVKDGLPERWLNVLVHMPGEKPHETVHEGYIGLRGWYAGGFAREDCEITHWMLLPEPPKEEA